jgi:TctA family transporter
VLFPAILFFCCIGTYSVNGSLNDVAVTASFGLMGYIFLRLSLDPAPLMLGFILGPMLEENFRRSLLLSRGSFSVFVTRPIAGTLIALIGLFVLWSFFVFVREMKAGRLARAEEGAAAAAALKEG